MGISVAVAFVAAMSLTEIAATVAVVGVALTIAGTVTHDKTMQQVGMGMGMAGGLAGLGFGLAGIGTMTLAEAGTGVGEFLTGGATTTAAATDVAAGATAAAAPVEAAAPAAGEAAADATGVGGIDQFGNAIAGPSPHTGGVAAIPYNDAGTAAATAGQVAPDAAAGAVATPVSYTPPAPVATDAAAEQFAQSVGEATNAPGTGVNELGGNLNRDLVSTNYTAPGTNAAGTGVLQSGVDPSVINQIKMGPPPGESAASWLEKNPALAMQMGMMGTQAIAGLAGGWFQGQSASDRLAFDKVLAGNAQIQTDRLNANNAYAPRISFASPRSGPAGVLTK